jgi:hypothetical protein
VFPGTNATAGDRFYDAYTFENGETNACINVTLHSTGAVYSAAYSNSYDGINFGLNYLADLGDSTDNGVTNYSFNVGPGARFVIVVNTIFIGDTAAYTLNVNGGSCRPRLNITSLPSNRVQIDWTTAALGYALERTNRLTGPGHPLWVPVTNTPVITAGRFRVTNTIPASPTNIFYQLRKP